MAAVCVYPTMVGIAREALEGHDINIASVATAFPSGQAPLNVKLEDTRIAVEHGANELVLASRGGANTDEREALIANVSQQIAIFVLRNRIAHMAPESPVNFLELRFAESFDRKPFQQHNTEAMLESFGDFSEQCTHSEQRKVVLLDIEQS